MATKRSIRIGAFALSLLLTTCGWAQDHYGGGTGDPNNPYLIYTPEQMNAIGANADDWDKHFKLMADIDLSAYTGTQFNIIGTGSPNPFSGTFDGNGRTISHLTWDSDGTDCVGLIGCMQGNGAQIKDLGLISPQIRAGSRHTVGALVGSLMQGSIVRCYVEGGRVTAERSVGGLVGYNSGEIRQCCAHVEVAAYSELGGLVGWNLGTIIGCYATGKVDGERVRGGLVGVNRTRGSIVHCYATAELSGEWWTGGLLGWNFGGAIVGSFWDIETGERTDSQGGTGKTT